MFEPESICPYTGLRSFTEEESLYFKGREEDIDQATEQLQRNKFLMLTGASGDGKSSLIYAGIIPNARAGFLKSKYTNWCVADFRPERSPFDNLCNSIARQLDIGNIYTVKSELDHGFSAIADLYKNSNRYIDIESIAWKKADDSGKAAMKREAANLIILVDQFEEFFTNPENYHRGVPSKDSNLVLNLLLETVRIALDEDLPIYVVFTMRSDYIGQCAAFRGLPEYIGFSQFFVPRLNRTQLQQVIEEPALLSGNRITRRLTERLIHDLTEGVDQLPILQHALNQIWHAADNGKQEMDLLHYAMVGGMPENELPDEQLANFRNWFEKLPPEIKACYHKPDLQNVLDTHTNKLYEQAEEYYLERTGKKIPDSDSKEVIRTAFTCLTKIDQSRAVRNRMTLREITNILNKPGYGTKEVGAILDIFREPGNTFIRPFITDDPGTRVLDEEDILDITHESLIRNWEYLGQWAKEEFDNHNVYLDLEQQLNRWLESDKSNGFLLSIGPLTYFEDWFKSVHPNAYWIARYLPEDIEDEKKLGKAKQELANTEEFLARSAKKHAVTRTIMRYGAKRIAAVIAVIVLITMSSFVVRDYIRKRNDQVLKSIRSETLDIANKPRLSGEFQAPPINEQLIMGNLTIPEVINSIKTVPQKIKVATAMATQMIIQGRNEPRKEIYECLFIIDSLFETVKLNYEPKNLLEDLKLLRDYTVTAGFAELFNTDPLLQELNRRNARRGANWVIQIYRDQPAGLTNIQMLSLALGTALQYGVFTEKEIDELLHILSPFENPARSQWIKDNYDKSKTQVRGSFNYGINYNGLFQDLAYLYAARGNTEKAVFCIDTILNYQQGFFQNDYALHADNASNIASVFHSYGNDSQLDSFARAYCVKKKIQLSEFYSRLISRHLIDESASSNLNFYVGGGGQIFYNLNIKLCTDSSLAFFFAKLKDAILEIKDPVERNFEHAVILKNELLAKTYRNEMRQSGENESNSAQYSEAVRLYMATPDNYLNEEISFAGSSAADPIISGPRKLLFLYPDFRVPFHAFEVRNSLFFYTSPSFISYLLEKNIFDSVYKSSDDLKYFELWAKDYHAYSISGDIYLHDPVPYEVLTKLVAKLETRQASNVADLNLIYLHVADQALRHNDTTKAIAYLKQIIPEKLLNSFQYKLLNFINTHSLQMVAKGIAALSASGEFDAAYRLINVFRNKLNRSSLYGYASQLVTIEYKKPAIGLRLLDSARAEMNRHDDPAVFQPNKDQVAIALMYMDPEENLTNSNRIIKNSNEKIPALSRFCLSFGYHGNLYKATQQVPRLISSSDKSYLLWCTLNGYNLRKQVPREWKRYKENEFFFAKIYLPYINEN